MGAGHSHRAGDDFEVPRVRRLVLLWVLGLTAVATVVGVVLLWPDGSEVDDVQQSESFAAPGVTFPKATVEEAEPACAERAPSEECGAVHATVAEGDDKGMEVRVDVPPEVSESGLEKGDTIRLISSPGADGADATYNYYGTSRSGTLWVLGILFVAVVLAVGRLRGFFALISLAITAAVFMQFMLPALLTGEAPVLVALSGCSAIMFVVLYLTHGLSIRTSAALAGTLLGVALTAALGAIFVNAGRMTGVAEESGAALNSYVDGLSFQGLLMCALVIAGLGVLNDVTITQASSVWELRSAGPEVSRRHLFTSAMRIGRDHIASAIYTILFAYAGTALLILLVLQLYGLPLPVLLSTEEIAQEVLRGFVTSIGLVLAVPITTGIAAITVPGAKTGAQTSGKTGGATGEAAQTV